MSPTTELRLIQLEEWRKSVEALKPDVIADRLARLDARVETLVKVFSALILGLIGALGGLITALIILLIGGSHG